MIGYYFFFVKTKAGFIISIQETYLKETYNSAVGKASASQARSGERMVVRAPAKTNFFFYLFAVFAVFSE